MAHLAGFGCWSKFEPSGFVCYSYPRDPSIQKILTLGPKVCRYYLHGAIGSLGIGSEPR